MMDICPPVHHDRSGCFWGIQRSRRRQTRRSSGLPLLCPMRPSGNLFSLSRTTSLLSHAPSQPWIWRLYALHAGSRRRSALATAMRRAMPTRGSSCRSRFSETRASSRSCMVAPPRRLQEIPDRPYVRYPLEGSERPALSGRVAPNLSGKATGAQSSRESSDRTELMPRRRRRTPARRGSARNARQQRSPNVMGNLANSADNRHAPQCSTLKMQPRPTLCASPCPADLRR